MVDLEGLICSSNLCFTSVMIRLFELRGGMILIILLLEVIFDLISILALLVSLIFDFRSLIGLFFFQRANLGSVFLTEVNEPVVGRLKSSFIFLVIRSHQNFLFFDSLNRQCVTSSTGILNFSHGFIVLLYF